MTSKQHTIQALPRTKKGRQNIGLRRDGFLPAVLYGPKLEPVNLQVSQKEFEQVFREAGENTLVDLVVEKDKPRKVLIHDVARHFMGQEPIHIDFYEVDLTKKITAHIPLKFEGVSTAVKELGGTLIRNHTEVEVEALPTDLPQFIEVNIDSLKTFDDSIRFSDLTFPEKVEFLGDADDVVALVQEPRTAEELEELDKPIAGEEEAAIEQVAGEEGEAGEGEGEEGKKEEKAEGGEPKGEAADNKDEK